MARKRERTGSASPHKSSGGMGLLHGLNSVEAALRAGRRKLGALHLRSGAPSERLTALRELAAQCRISVHEKKPAELEAFCRSPQHQGAVLQCGPLPIGDAIAALGADTTPGGPPPLWVVLDQVEDPRNLGAVVRSCAAFGVAGLVLPRGHSAPLSAAASSASAGTMETFPIHETTNLARFLEAAKKKGCWIAGAVTDGGVPIHEFRHDTPLVLVLGSEGRGMRPLVRKQCDHLLRIPLPGADRMASLNVSAAAAVVLYALTSGRR